VSNTTWRPLFDTIQYQILWRFSTAPDAAPLDETSVALVQEAWRQAAKVLRAAEEVQYADLETIWNYLAGPRWESLIRLEVPATSIEGST
jgi:hypothetical protein